MNEEYTYIFQHMFFNTNSNDDVREILDDASEVYSILICKLGEVANELNYCEEVDGADAYLHLVISMFVRKLMEQVDAINILYSYGLVNEAELILRPLLETVISLKFILQKEDVDREETRFRAAAYYMGQAYQERRYANKYLKPDGILDKRISLDVLNAWNKQDAAFSNLIQKNAVFKRVDAERNKLKKPETSKWYDVAGVHNFKEMMTEVGMEKYYEGLYGSLSMEMHAYNVAMSINVKDDGIYPDEIRSPHNGGNTFGLTSVFVIMALQDLYKFLGDGNEEKKDFEEFYKEFAHKRDIAEKNLNKIVH